MKKIREMKNLMYLIATGFLCASCSFFHKNMEEVNATSAKEIMSVLYESTDGDVEALSRVLNVPLTNIDSVRNGQIKPSADEESQLRAVYLFYENNGQSFSKVRSQYDKEWNWWDDVCHFPIHHPYWFWGIIVVLCIKWIWELIVDVFGGFVELFLDLFE